MMTDPPVPSFNTVVSASRSLLLLVLSMLAPTSYGQVKLNEILAVNKNGVSNGSDSPDYIEVANLSASPVSLAGFSLTDDPSIPRRFVFPNGVSIPGGGYLVVWCDVNASSPGLHAGFALGAQGEHVQLYAADGVTLLDELSFGFQAPNLSIGRVPDGTGSWSLNAMTPGGANRTQDSGPKNQMRINEWMARPFDGDDWIELYNAGNWPVTLSGMVLTDSSGVLPQNRPILPLSFIGPGGFVQFFASDLDEPDADHLDFKLSAGGETLTLFDTDRTTVLDRITFGEQTTDVSQGRTPDGGDRLTFFPAGRATPGEANIIPLASVVISEVLTHADLPFEDAIELQNVGPGPVDISHWWLSDSASEPQKYRIPPGTMIPLTGFIVFYEYQFSTGPNGFSLNSAQGDEVYLSAADAAGNLLGQQSSVEVGTLRNGVSVGRVVTSVGVDFVPLERPTFWVEAPSNVLEFRLGKGRANAPARVGVVVISEIYRGAANADSDGDGMPDEWEIAHGLLPQSAADTVEDPDQDGLANKDEFLAGTDPRDAHSVLRISSFERRGAEFRLTSSVIQGKPYSIQACEVLPGGHWLTATNLDAAPLTGLFEFPVPAPSWPAAWYRIRVPANP